jgi:hypothetical protein
MTQEQIKIGQELEKQIDLARPGGNWSVAGAAFLAERIAEAEAFFSVPGQSRADLFAATH